jgi:hypothetical protein
VFCILLKMYVRNVNNFIYVGGIYVSKYNFYSLSYRLDSIIGFEVSVLDKIFASNSPLYMDLSFKNQYTSKCFRLFSKYPNGTIYDAKIEFDKNYILKDIMGYGGSHQISLYAIPRTISFAYKNTELFSQNIRENGALIVFAFKELCSDIMPIIVEFLANEVIADLSLYKCVNP